MMHYKPVKITINALGLSKVILNMVVRHYNLLNSIISDRGSLFTLKFKSLLYYFFKVKWQLSITAILRQIAKPNYKTAQ